MGINECLLAFALFLFVIDIFFASDIPTHIAYIIVTYVLANSLPMYVGYRLTAAVFIWFGLVLLHYLVWKNFVSKHILEALAPTKHKVGLDFLVGRSGVARVVEGKMFVQVFGELYVFEPLEELQDGDDVTVVGHRNNSLVVTKIYS